MRRYLTIGKLVILAVALVILAVIRAQAGASASAPSKNGRSTQLAAQQTDQKSANDLGITEYSSSSARNPAH